MYPFSSIAFFLKSRACPFFFSFPNSFSQKQSVLPPFPPSPPLFILFLFCLLCPLLSTHSLSNQIWWNFDQMRQQEETCSHSSLFIHSPAICPSSESTWMERHAVHKRKALSQVSTAPRSPLLCHSLSPLLPQSAESIAPLHLSVHSIRANNGSALDKDCLLLWLRMSITKLDRTDTTTPRWYACVWQRKRLMDSGEDGRRWQVKIKGE